jgi:DNA-directed RNA polymerase specialized sigma24 family protein
MDPSADPEGYQPPESGAATAREALSEDLLHGRLTADELLRRYCTLVYAETGSYEETARCLQLDRRTVKSKIDVPKLS